MEQRDQDYARHLAKASDEIIVFSIRCASACGMCSAAMGDGGLLMLREGKPQCMACAGLDDLVFLPSGDPALTRRAAKLSNRRAIVVRWARTHKRYVRQGTLVEEAAIASAKEQCATDQQKRDARNARAAIRREADDKCYQAAFLAELQRLFPRCPETEAQETASHACEKHSGRVGRSASAKELDTEKIRLAVIAHIRHTHTGYDEFLANNVNRRQARQLIQAKVQRVLAQWQ